MSKNPPAHHPADNASLRATYGKGTPMEVAFVKNNKFATGEVWFMYETAENRARYNEIMDADNPPQTRIEVLERAGATFFSHWYQCESLRTIKDPPTITSDIMSGVWEKTAGNLQLAEEELNNNTRDLDEAQIVEERKTLQWLQEEVLQVGRGEELVHEDEQEQAGENSNAQQGEDEEERLESESTLIFEPVRSLL